MQHSKLTSEKQNINLSAAQWKCAVIYKVLSSHKSSETGYLNVTGITNRTLLETTLWELDGKLDCAYSILGWLAGAFSSLQASGENGKPFFSSLCFQVNFIKSEMSPDVCFRILFFITHSLTLAHFPTNLMFPREQHWNVTLQLSPQNLSCLYRNAS